MKNRELLGHYAIGAVCLFCLLLTGRPVMAATRTGFTLHFDFINSWDDAKQIILVAHENGAEILNVVPPPQLWKLPASREILDKIFDLTGTLHMQVLLSRIDGCPVSADDPQRINYLFKEILNRPGILPTGKPTPRYFRETVGLGSYEQWLQTETAYYAGHYAGRSNLAGFSVGLFNEPFVSQRGSLLCFDFDTNSYEIAQYTPSCKAHWHKWLKNKYNGIEAVNERYAATFASFDAVPMPKNEQDLRFGRAPAAYADFAASINDWVVQQYRDCQAVWSKSAGKVVPFILQLSGYVPEKFANGRPAFAALDIYAWIQMADAVGLSLYTNKQYDDWGHSSDKAMVNFLYLGVLQKKPVYVMEGGSENDGPVLPRREIEFFANAARVLCPCGQIYEFSKPPYYVKFSHHSGYIMDCAGTVNKKACGAVKAALRQAQQECRLSDEIYVFDDPRALSTENDDLPVRKQLQIAALDKNLVFVPPESLALVPDGARLLVIQQQYPGEVARLAARGIKVSDAREWLRSGE